MAMSADGIIASQSGNEDFLSHDNWIEFVRLLGQTGSFIWGRKTYESVLTWDPKYIRSLDQFTKIIISSNSSLSLVSSFDLADSPHQALQILQDKGFTQTILTGGATNNTSFAKEGLIDEVILNVEPVVVGTGVRLFSGKALNLKLELMETTKVTEQIPQFHYQVIKK